MSESESSYRADGTLINAYNTLGGNSPIANIATGLGTSRDKSSYGTVADAPKLSERDRIALVRSSRIARRAVFTYPRSAASGWVNWTFGSSKVNPQSLHDYADNLLTGSLKAAFLEASIESRWHGNGYILLGIDDGQEWDQPINEQRIRSFRWAEPLCDFEVQPDTQRGYRKPEFYRITTWNRQLEMGTQQRTLPRVHRSRLLCFHGDSLTGSALQYTDGKHDSVLQTMFNAFSAAIQGIGASSAMLQDYSVFRYKLKGLAKMCERGDVDAIMTRFMAIQMGMSIAKGLAMDAETEDADFVSRSYGGVKDILEVLIEQMVAVSDMPRYKLLGTSAVNGLGQESSGQAQRYEWASLVQDWQQENWYEPLRWCMKLMLLAKDGITGGVLPEGWNLEFPTILQLTRKEELELRKLKAEENAININIGIYTPLEARSSGYGAAVWSPEIILDERITKMMEEEAMKTPEEKLQEQQEALAANVSSSNRLPADGTGDDDSLPDRRSDAIDTNNPLTDSQWEELAGVDDEAVDQVLEDLADSSSSST